MNEITFEPSYTAKDRDEFDRLVLAVDRLCSNIKSTVRRPRQLSVRANFSRGGIVCVDIWESNYDLRHYDNGVVFEGVDLFSETNPDKSRLTLQIGSDKYLVTLGP